MRDCPHPEKHAYPSKRIAKRTLRRSVNFKRAKVQAYRCVCGMWHLGHKPGAR